MNAKCPDEYRYDLKLIGALVLFRLKTIIQLPEL